MNCKIFDLGLIEFIKASNFQKGIFQRVKADEFSAALIFCRHYPVITMGRSAKKEHILKSEAELRRKNILLYEVERGGDVTYHGPGQFMVYPVMNLAYFKKDIHYFLRQLEGLIINVLGRFGIKGERVKGYTGVWIDSRKIASIGIAIRDWITFHGLAINVKQDDLDNFTLIRPCGMDIMMTSMETVLRKELAMNEIKEAVMNENLF